MATGFGLRGASVTQRPLGAAVQEHQAANIGTVWDIHTDDLIPSRAYRRVHYGEAEVKDLMTPLREAWAALPPRLKILEPVPFSAEHWSLVERLHANFNDREAQTHLPIRIARFREAASKTIYDQAKQFDDVHTVYVDDRWLRRRSLRRDGAAMAASTMTMSMR